VTEIADVTITWPNGVVETFRGIEVHHVRTYVGERLPGRAVEYVTITIPMEVTP